MMKHNSLSLSRSIVQLTRGGIAWMLFCSAVRCASAQQLSSPPPASNGLYTDLDPSMAIVILVLISAFFCVAFFSFYVRHCAEANAGGYLPSGGRSRKRGLDAAVIESFPVFVYSEVKDLKLGKGALECAVCLSEFEDDETLRLMPKCDHVFHPDCIGAWLASHVTCPVCRANLTPECTETVKSTEATNELYQSNWISESSRVVVIDVNDEQSGSEARVLETANTGDATPKTNRLPRAGFAGEKFPRSHSTGHSLVQAGPDVERYTLRLPEEVRKQIIMNGKLKRTQSFNAVLARQGSSKKGRSTGGEGSSRGRSRSERWVFSMTPPFVSRIGSVNSVKVDGDGSSRGKTLLTAVKVPLNCLNVKVEVGQGSESSSSRLQTLVVSTPTTLFYVMGRITNLIGLIKDKVSQSKAAISSNPGTLSLHLSLLRATSHDSSAPPNPKHLSALLDFGHSSRATTAAVIETLMDRLQTTRDVFVALKCLITVHNIIKHGSFILQDQLSVYPATGGRNYLKLSDFRDNSTPVTWELSLWVRWYALYLEHLLSTSRVLGFFLGSTSTTAENDKEEEMVSALMNSDLLRDIDSLVGLLEEMSKRPDPSLLDSNKLVEEVVGLVGEDYLSAINQVSTRVNEFRERLSCLSLGDSVELACALKRLEICKERLVALLTRKQAMIETFWSKLSQLKDEVGKKKMYREERMLVAIGRRNKGSESARFGDRVLSYNESVRFSSGRFG